jgi:DNA-binding NarL/FixJ family response regulator
MGIMDIGTLRVREELAALELSRDNYAAALQALGPELVVDPATLAIDSTLPTRSEALIRLGRLDEARDALERFEVRVAAHRGSPFASADVDAGLGRVRALFAAARGEMDEATRLAAEALQTYEEVNDLWSRARALLVAADIHRRARRRADAHMAATEALELFQHFGAVLWADRARDILRRIGSAPRDAGRLTPTQAQVAELAVRGLTNRQIADRLFMSAHTVEAHLSAVYRTLGIGSRRELGPALRDSTAENRDSDTTAGLNL